MVIHADKLQVKKTDYMDFIRQNHEIKLFEQKNNQ